MSYFEFLIKLTDLSLTGLFGFLLYRVVTKLLPDFIRSQQQQAASMGRMAASVDMAARAAETYQVSIQTFQEMQKEQMKSTTAILQMCEKTQADNLQAHKMLFILVRTMNDKLEAIGESLPKAG